MAMLPMPPIAAVRQASPNALTEVPSKAEFAKHGPVKPLRSGDRYVVSAMMAAFNPDPDLNFSGPLDAMEEYWEGLFHDSGGWTLQVWDIWEDSGWLVHYVGPEWICERHRETGVVCPPEEEKKDRLAYLRWRDLWPLVEKHRDRPGSSRRPPGAGIWDIESVSLLCPDFTRYSTKAAFKSAGGRLDPKNSETVEVSLAPESYPDLGPNPLDAAAAYWESIAEARRTVFAWDHDTGQGWSYPYFGPDFAYRVYACIGELPPLTSPSPSVPSVLPDDMNVVNSHRRQLGMKPLDLADGWTAKEIAEMAEKIRATGRMANPARGLKRKLMR
jgi:hypothetical protein